MILWVDGDHDPAENMRRDTSLLAAAERGAAPVLRLFGFRPWGITLGHGQRAEHALDLARCAADRVPWVARPTGGRAIFHAQEWTFSLAAPQSGARHVDRQRVAARSGLLSGLGRRGRRRAAARSRAARRRGRALFAGARAERFLYCARFRKLKDDKESHGRGHVPYSVRR